MNTQFQPLTITNIREEAPGVKTFEFGADDGKKITYEPGQFLTLVFWEGGQEVRRSYSITSAPALGEPLTIGVKRIANGLVSRMLIDQATVGEQLITAGASGFFTLPANFSHYRQVYFWAAGSGITPIFSLLKTLLFTAPEISVVLVYSNQSPEVALFRQELEQLHQQHGERFTLILLFSNARRLDQARLHRDLLKKLVRQTLKVSVAEILCYVCGPLDYRRLCLYGLRELQVPLENIKQEVFTPLRVASVLAPPDTQAHEVTLRVRGQAHQFLVQYPETILQAARRFGVAMPFSCEAGICGNCSALCEQGEVWMANNEVLTQRQLAQGKVLTCVGYPLGGPVVLSM
ncbi:flavin reductase family protein [Rufibacter quisquiliarum]|uniref:Ring-1,2-phenylacetyl-CoA epoxidase subunit PaaE n=1 Tax=Rufibacter quisquiliarum TaxID=1549639 RepID=A0A839GVL2_9BACT|nr:iron-sulfur cluster-binding domain-containing protein [Rufibacter quisquiliarum]MBA9077801.1 ring-1,2-phenylacetyl-CoA epoxidase subunit PaaE [Rufibacter quisquiliarum]